DLGTGKSQAITITASSGLSKEEIERMVTEAQRYAEEDRKFKETQELKNQADSLAYAVEHQLRELGNQLSEEERRSIQEKVDALRKAVAGDDLSEIQRCQAELEREQHRLAQRLYERATAGGGSSGEETVGAATSEGEVIDAEYKEQKDA
ncbi:MAG: Hsp70 family protein, partial [Fimbriimonadales bacterium]|nr:Hsp70 family protein [Fimbriimonadales bacterium]